LNSRQKQDIFLSYLDQTRSEAQPASYPMLTIVFMWYKATIFVATQVNLMPGTFTLTQSVRCIGTGVYEQGSEEENADGFCLMLNPGS
jgi:hypothetical protein